MRLARLRTLFLLLPLLLLSACTASPGEHAGDVAISIHGQFEKRVLTSSGFSGTVQTKDARHCYVEICANDGSATPLDGFYLDENGRGIGYAPPGTDVFVVLYAAYEVPCSPASSTDFFMRGSVIYDNGASRYAPPFQFRDAWYTGDSVDHFNSSSVDSVTILSTLASHTAGAFNIADQAVTLFSSVRDLNTNLRLANLHTYWSTNLAMAYQPGLDRYPYVAKDSQNQVLRTSSSRAIFTNALNGLDGGANTETDEWDDATIREACAHLLFADYSLNADGSSAWSLLRRDNDNVYVDRTVQSESTVAFVGGFCDFLAAASANNSLLLDSYKNGSNTLVVDAFDLSSHSQVPSAARSEFARGSVAVSLWGIWKNALSGSPAGLQLLWNACNANSTNEYLNAPLGCYPSYLMGLERLAGSSYLYAIQSELNAENIGNGVDVTSLTYLNSSALWSVQNSIPFSDSATTLTTYSTATYFDRGQAQAYRFYHGGGARTITLTTSSPGLRLELFDALGYYAGTTASSGHSGQLAYTSSSPLPYGTYAVRVRLDPSKSFTSGTAAYTLSVD